MKIRKYIENIRKRTTVPAFMAGTDIILENDKTVCLYLSYRTETEVSRYLKSNATKMIKMANPGFACVNLAYIFAENSPYVERFSFILQKILESRILKMATK